MIYFQYNGGFKMDDKNLNIHFRLYDKDIIKMTERILKENPEEFKGKEDLCKKAAENEIRRIYGELFEDENKIESINEADLTLRVDQCFVMINTSLKLLSAILNIETDKLAGNKVKIENILEGLYDELPQRFRKLMETLFVN